MSDTETLHLPVAPSYGEQTIPIDLSRATNYERQEIEKAYRDAFMAANNIARMGVYFSEMLSEGGRFHPNGDVGTLDAGGDFQPGYAATKFIVAATRLKDLVESMDHRLAVHDPQVEVTA